MYLTTEHIVKLCDSTTGHVVSNIAFCDSKERAERITKCLEHHDGLVDMLEIMTERFYLAIKHNGTDDEYAKIACADANALLEKVRQ